MKKGQVLTSTVVNPANPTPAVSAHGSGGIQSSVIIGAGGSGGGINSSVVTKS